MPTLPTRPAMAGTEPSAARRFNALSTMCLTMSSKTRNNRASAGWTTPDTVLEDGLLGVTGVDEEQSDGLAFVRVGRLD